MSTLLKKKPARAPSPKAKKKKSAIKKEGQEKFSFKRLLLGEEKPDLTELESGSTTILDILSPTTVDTKSRDYIVVDGVFHAYLYVTGYGYATTVGSCWLAPLVEAGEGVNLSFIFKRQPKDKILSKIAQTIMVNRSRMRDVEDTRSDFEELDSAISSGLYLKDVMNRQGEDFYYMHTLIEVVADDPETLEQRVTAVEKLCVVKNYDPEKEALRISVKETESNPFEGAEFRHPAGSRRQAVIAGKYGGGVFCNLPDGTVCMCNYSYQHEDSDFLVGDTVILVVQRHEREKRQMYGKILSKW